MARTLRSRGDRIALWLKARGKCQHCGITLDKGWHVDHVLPWSHGGETTIRNSQALCPSCNLKKGNRSVDTFVRRDWGERLISTVDQRISRGIADDPSERVIVINAFCGSGKTLGFLDAGNLGYRRGSTDMFLAFTPRVNLCRQYEEAWRDNCGKFSGKRMGRVCHVRNDPPLIRPDLYEGPQGGVVATYQSLVAKPDLYKNLCETHRVFLVLDEGQILGASEDEMITKAAEEVSRLVSLCPITLLGSGTAFRSDYTQIMYGKYSNPDVSGKRYLKADVDATYSEGVAQQYLRKIDFVAAHDGEAWKRYLDVVGDPEKIVLSEQRFGLRDTYRQEGIWRPIVDRTVDEIRGQRRIDKRWKSIFGACDINHAKEIHRYLCRHHSDMHWSLVTSEDPESIKTLERFKRNNHAGAVSVAMIYIGYDCPWICKVAILNQFRFIGWLDQFAFRGGRVISEIPYDDQTLQVIGGADPLLLYWFKVRRADMELGLKSKGDGPKPPPKTRRPFVMTGGEITSVISLGHDPKNDLSSEDQDKLERLVRANGWFDLSLPLRIRLLRDWEAGGNAIPTNSEIGGNPEKEPFESYDDQLKRWRSKLHQMNATYCSEMMRHGNPEGWDYGYSAVFKKFDVSSTDKASVSDLQKYFEYLDSACAILRKSAV